MSRKRILFVGEDLALWEQLQNPFPNAEGPWDVAFAKSGLQALASMSQSPCDAIVADMAIPGMTGAQLLDEVMQRSPGTLRFIRASMADQQAAMRCVGTAHQYLFKPCDADPERDLAALGSIRGVAHAGAFYASTDLRRELDDDLAHRDRTFARVAAGVLARVSVWSAARRFAG